MLEHGSIWCKTYLGSSRQDTVGDAEDSGKLQSPERDLQMQMHDSFLWQF